MTVLTITRLTIDPVQCMGISSAHLRRTITHRVQTRWLATALALAAVVIVLSLTVHRPSERPVAAQGGPPGRAFTAGEVLDAFRAAGLAVENPREQATVSSPSGPPQTEREAWAFEIPSVAPSGGRVLVFMNGEGLQRKAAWFRRAGASVIVFGNVILWLDPALEPAMAARYRQALQGLR